LCASNCWPTRRNPGAAGSAAARAGPNERRVSSRNQLSTTALE
jgi:hypothetical protein